MNILVLGNQASDPVLHGTGSGNVYEKWVLSPIQAVGDELGVESYWNIDPFWRSCNDETGNCVTYIGLANTNGAMIDLPPVKLIID